MENFLSPLVGFGAWLLRNSFQASVVIGLVVLAQWVFQKKLSPRWRYVLWSLVLIRLMLPVSLESTFSIFNYTKAVSAFAPETVATQRAVGILPADQANAPAEHQQQVSAASPPPSERQDLTSSGANAKPPNVDPGARTALSARIDSTNENRADKAVRAPIRRNSASQSNGTAPPFPRSTLHSLYIWLSLLWLAGALLLAARIIWFPIRLNAQLAQHEIATGPAVFDILEQSKRLMRMRKVLPIVQSRAVKSAALMGFIRPWQLLPDGMVEGFTPKELRFVFLHELAHLKRRDIASN